jgi:hypothetical protein
VHVRLAPVAVGADVEHRDARVAVVAGGEGAQECGVLVEEDRVVENRRHLVAGRAGRGPLGRRSISIFPAPASKTQRGVT